MTAVFGELPTAPAPAGQEAHGRNLSHEAGLHAGETALGTARGSPSPAPHRFVDTVFMRVGLPAFRHDKQRGQPFEARPS